MRPRSKLLSQKRRLQLPTIREGYEDLVRNKNQLNQMNQSNALHSAQPTTHPGPCPHTLSSEDYLLSICHLAHPTSLPTNDIINPRQQDSLHQRQRLPRFAVEDENSPKTTALSHREKAHGKDRVEHGMYYDLITVCRGQEKDSNCSKPAFGRHGASDPLEFLYSSSAHSTFQSGNGSQGLGLRRHWAVSEGQSCPRAHSYPRSCSSDLQQQRKSSCPTFIDTATPDCAPSLSYLTTKPSQTCTSTQDSAEQLHTTISSPLNNENKGAEKERKEERERESSTVKHSLISQWMSDCRCAWKEARVRACILPTIADM